LVGNNRLAAGETLIRNGGGFLLLSSLRQSSSTGLGLCILFGTVNSLIINNRVFAKQIVGWRLLGNSGKKLVNCWFYLDVTPVFTFVWHNR
jgi:hypothetical protein